MYRLSPAEAGMIVLALCVLFALVLLTGMRRVPDHQRGVIRRFGAAHRVSDPGWVLVRPMIEQMTRVETGTRQTDLSSREVTTVEGIKLEIEAVLTTRVVDPERAVSMVEDHHDATVTVARTFLRHQLGEYSLDELTGAREDVNETLRRGLDDTTRQWGVEVSSFGIVSARKADRE